MLRKLLLPVFLLSSFHVLAQDADFFKPDSVRRKIAAVKITSSIKVDGVLNEPEWKLPAPSIRFTQIEPHQGQPSDFLTEIKVLYNSQNLYFGIIAHDPLGKKAIRATDFVRDFDYLRHDLVTLAFDGFNDKRNAMAFATNAYGVQRDYLAYDDLLFDIDWNGLWSVRTTRSDSGWVAEIAIPWKTLRYPKSKDSVQSWGFNAYRNRRLTNEISAFSPFPRVFSATRMDYAGLLTNLQPPPPGTNIRVNPYLLTSYDHYSNSAGIAAPTATHYKIGGDLKWAITPNSVLDLTANTDFAQADADIQVNNVTQFSVFFPEKRQFFLENASLFSFNIQMQADGSGGSMNLQPFFSRSIGLDNAGNPIPLTGGGRFVLRSDKLNYGAIAMRQDSYNSEPGTNFFVGRISENLGSQSRVGALFTIKNQPGHTNIESTADGFFRLNDENSLNAIFTHSISTDNHQQGFAGIAQFYHSTNHYKFWWTESIVTKNFDPEMGFVSRKDIIGTTPGLNWYYRGSLLPFKRILRAYEPGILPELYIQQSTGKFTEFTLPVWPIWLNFQSGAFFGYAVQTSIMHLNDPFQPLGTNILVGNYSFTRQWIYASTDPSKIVNLAVNYVWGPYYNGSLTSSDVKLQFAPIPHISLIGEFNRNHFVNVGTPAFTKAVDLYILQGRFALNPRVQLSSLLQKNTLDNSRAYNVRFSWEFAPLSYIYLVYNHGSVYNRQMLQSTTEDHLIGKISFLKQF